MSLGWLIEAERSLPNFQALVCSTGSKQRKPPFPRIALRGDPHRLRGQHWGQWVLLQAHRVWQGFPLTTRAALTGSSARQWRQEVEQDTERACPACGSVRCACSALWVEGGCLASAVGRRERVVDALMAWDSEEAKSSFCGERNTASSSPRALQNTGEDMWNGWDVMESWHSACVSPSPALSALRNVKAPSAGGSWAIPSFAVGRALWDVRVKAE